MVDVAAALTPSDAATCQVLSSPALLAWNAAWLLIVPLWRDVHFYIAHRFIHIRAIYR